MRNWLKILLLANVFCLVLVLGLLIRLQKARFETVLLNAARYEQQPEQLLKHKEDSYESFVLYFLGFRDRWFINGLQPVKLKAMVFGYLDNKAKPQLVYFAGVGKYKGKALGLDYFEQDGGRRTYRDEAEAMGKMKPFTGRLVEVAVTRNLSEGQRRSNREWLAYLDEGRPWLKEKILASLEEEKGSFWQKLYALPTWFVDAENPLKEYVD